MELPKIALNVCKTTETGYIPRMTDVFLKKKETIFISQVEIRRGLSLAVDSAHHQHQRC